MNEFIIDTDEKAEWALGKIKEATEERDRLLALADSQEQILKEKRKKIEDDFERDTSYLSYLLQRYMETVKVKTSKTQDSYQLLSGKLVRKHPKTDYQVADEEKLLTWLTENNREDLIKVKRAPMWAELKKLVSGDPETGICVLSETGEHIEGVAAIETPEKFDIKF